MEREDLSHHRGDDGSARAGDDPEVRPRAGRRLLLGPDGSAREETVSTPQVPPGPHSPAPDDSPTARSALARHERASAVERARRMVPEGTFAVGAGLAISGITAYGFQILAFRGLSKPDYAALNALWVFVFVLAPGVFLPLEQEVGRAVSARRVRGVGGGPVI